jgi:hypothetical protein
MAEHTTPGQSGKITDLTDEEVVQNIRTGLNYLNPFLQEAFARNLIVSIRPAYSTCAFLLQPRELMAFARKETTIQF